MRRIVRTPRRRRRGLVFRTWGRWSQIVRSRFCAIPQCPSLPIPGSGFAKSTGRRGAVRRLPSGIEDVNSRESREIVVVGGILDVAIELCHQRGDVARSDHFGGEVSDGISPRSNHFPQSTAPPPTKPVDRSIDHRRCSYPPRGAGLLLRGAPACGNGRRPIIPCAATRTDSL